MPSKKLFLDITSPRRTSPKVVVPESSVNVSHAGASLKVTENGSFNVYSTSQEYKFTPEGLVRKKGRAAIEAVDSDQLSYKISEKDVRIIRTIGRGASSVVYKAFLARCGKFVAIKRINCFEREKRHQMMNDIKALCNVTEPSLVQFIGAYHAPENGQIALVLEYMNGGSLADILQKRGSIPEDVLSVTTAQVLQGLSYLHRYKHMVHRDIKPANILLDLSGVAKIADFGISAFVDNTMAVCHTFTGTVTYMSPERINSRPYSFPADIWSLGLILLECATGRYPYDASDGPLQLMIQVVEEPVPLPQESAFSAEFRSFVAACMQKDPFKRPTAEGLLSHPFILKHTRRRPDMRSFMRCMEDQESIQEQMAVDVPGQFYRAMSEGREGVASTSSLYAEDSMYTNEGVSTRGRAAIVQRLQGLAELHAAFGSGTHQTDTIDSLPMQDGGLLVHVMGHFRVGGSGPLALGPQGAGPDSLFSEVFLIYRDKQGRPTIRNQLFRLL
ncbi:Mitogen-activated protein kinase kinase 3 [Coccomyxa sp. Obi]|nr:Mitogen-activated protein kinase kinase 3 [Coccomyxa sp. Obi]